MLVLVLVLVPVLGLLTLLLPSGYPAASASASAPASASASAAAASAAAADDIVDVVDLAGYHESCRRVLAYNSSTSPILFSPSTFLLQILSRTKRELQAQWVGTFLIHWTWTWWV